MPLYSKLEQTIMPHSIANGQDGRLAVQHVPLCLCSLRAAPSQFSVSIGRKIQLAGITYVMRYARTHKLQMSGPTVHLYTVVKAISEP